MDSMVPHSRLVPHPLIMASGVELVSHVSWPKQQIALVTRQPHTGMWLGHVLAITRSTGHEQLVEDREICEA